MSDTERAQARDLSLRGVRPPVKVPGYEQEQFLGHGAYGEVWVAVNRNSGRKVAIKFYTRRGGTDWAALAREVEKLRYLFSDRYVVQLFEVGWESDPPYYVMEYMEHGSLEDLLRTGPLSAHDAVHYFRDVAVALVHAHNKGILHCDLKPGNILIDHDRRPSTAGPRRACAPDQRDCPGAGYAVLHGPGAGRPVRRPGRPVGRVRARRGDVPHAHRRAAALPEQAPLRRQSRIATRRVPQA